MLSRNGKQERASEEQGVCKEFGIERAKSMVNGYLESDCIRDSSYDVFN